MLHSKFWQGFFALAPLGILITALMGYFIFLFASITQLPEWEHRSGDMPWAFFAGLGIFLFLIFLVILLSLGSLVFYIVHAAQNPDLRENNLLVVWILLFVFANGLGQLIYWIIEILNKKPKNTT
jgi:hypothetical protein